MDMTSVISGGEMIAAWGLIALPMSALVLFHLCFQQLVEWCVRKVKELRGRVHLPW